MKNTIYFYNKIAIFADFLLYRFDISPLKAADCHTLCAFPGSKLKVAFIKSLKFRAVLCTMSCNFALFLS